MFRVLSNQHYQYRTNQKLRSWTNAVFQNRGVCGQAFPSFPSPSPVIPFFRCRPNFCRRTRAETLATQARSIYVLWSRSVVLSLCFSPFFCSVDSLSSSRVRGYQAYILFYERLETSPRESRNKSSLWWNVLWQMLAFVPQNTLFFKLRVITCSFLVSSGVYISLPRSRFLDVTQRSSKRKSSFGGALRDIQKRLRGRPSVYSTTEYISVLEIFCEILLYGTVDLGLLVSLLVVKLL